MIGFENRVKAGGKKMKIYGVITLILGILCLMAPGLTGISIVTLVGLFVLAGGIVRMMWALQAEASCLW